jgi:capsular polysaccharide transport system permease protein
MAVWFYVLWMCGLEEAKPNSVATCIPPLVFLAILGIGVGLVNATISKFFPLWDYIFGLKSRGALIFAGVFFVTDYLPYPLRSVLVFSPLIHGVEWFRKGLYGIYPDSTLDTSYLVWCALGTLFVGLASYRGTMRVVAVAR